MTPGETAPPLDDASVDLYARQIIVPGVGSVGQARLCNATVAAMGNRWGAEAALSYLAAAGLRAVRWPCDAPPAQKLDVIVWADVTRMLVADLPPAPLDTRVAWYALEGDTITGGLTTLGALPTLDLPATNVTPRDGALDRIVHRVGGLDAAATAIAAILDWQRSGERHALGMRPERPAGAQDAAGGIVSERS